MFCPNCGKQLPEEAQFCSGCGKAVRQTAHKRGPDEPCELIGTQTGPASSTGEKGFGQHSAIAEGSPVREWIDTAICLLRQYRVLVIAAIVVIVGVGTVVSLLRASNERALSQSVPNAIYENSKATVTGYYDKMLSVPFDQGGYLLGCDYESFSLRQSQSDKNMFMVTGNLMVTDLSQGTSRRDNYTISITGTLTTNFMRSDWEAEWGYTMEEPALNPYDTVTVQALFNAYNSNGVSADRQYGGRWLNVIGEIKEMYTYATTAYVVLEYYTTQGLSFDVFQAYFALDSDDPNLAGLTVGQTVTLTGYLPNGYDGLSRLSFESGTVYGGSYPNRP